MLDIAEVIATFLRQHRSKSRDGYIPPILLALSGGVDSLALFFALLRCRERGLLSTFAVAHVDHRWRGTSTSEAMALEALVLRHGVTWHLHTLDPSKMEGNQEEASRRERLCFFERLCLHHGYQAVLLAHHADDQAETVLKRIFESASLTALAAMTPVSHYGNLTLWRPLLHTPKKVLEHWVLEHGETAIEDSTNGNIAYLRARMRAQLIPQLAAVFGKEIAAPLSELAADAQELVEYLSDLCRMPLNSFELGWAGVMMDTSNAKQLPLLALRFLLQRLLRKAGCSSLSRHQLKSASQQLQSGAANKCYSGKGAFLYIDRHYAFADTAPLVAPSTDLQPLVMGIQRWDSWVIEVTQATIPSFQTGWHDAWRGRIKVTVSAGDYFLGPPRQKARHISRGKSLDRLWTDAKVPAFLRPLLPVLYYNGQVLVEFLSGHKGIVLEPPYWHIELVRRSKD